MKRTSVVALATCVALTMLIVWVSRDPSIAAEKEDLKKQRWEYHIEVLGLHQNLWVN